jgi:nitroreductase
MRPFTIDDVFNRRSCSEFLDDPIKPEELDVIFRAAMSGNDHGRLQPWEFRLYSGSGRERLADAFLKHAVASGAEPRQMEKARKDPFKAPVVICVSTLKRECKIPFRDQVFSAVSSCQLITLTAHLIGLAAIWKTGAWATSAIVRESLGIAPDDEIVGFIYLGTPAKSNVAVRDFPDGKIWRFVDK